MTSTIAPSFIETQFPISKLSKESYKERKANYSQTLTGLGKWWGRKPLIMVRAIILGLLMPASNDPAKDRDVFLALLTMDADGLRRRKSRNIPLKDVYRLLSPPERTRWFEIDVNPDRPRLKKGTKAAARKCLQMLVFDRLGYDDKLRWCDRPEQIDGPSPESWQLINAHLGTNASDLPEIVRELGERRFGHVPRVGDAFCGGGSVPFEAARIGCEAFGSDLNPVAALLTWGALNIVGGGKAVAEEVRAAQESVFDAVDRQVTDWRIEHNEFGWRADAFLYCTETHCPECDWRVPLAPSWLIGERTHTIATLDEIPGEKAYRIDIHSGADQEAMKAAAESGTIRHSRLECPHCDDGASTSMRAIRGDGVAQGVRGAGLRQWETDDLVPRPHDVLQERLYCVRWRLPPLDALLWAEQGGEAAPIPDWVDLQLAIEALAGLLTSDARNHLAKLRARNWFEEDRVLADAERELSAAKAEDKRPGGTRELAQRVKGLRDLATARRSQVKALLKGLPQAIYRAVDEADTAREACTLALMQERLEDWQNSGFIPKRPIVSGKKTDEPIQTRGWTHWHHLFTPRQLLTHGLFAEHSATRALSVEAKVGCILGVGRIADWNSKLSRWHPHSANEKSEQVFSNQALNTLETYGGRSTLSLKSAWSLRASGERTLQGTVHANDARAQHQQADIWVTDPPYADAVNYQELSEFFLAWQETTLLKVLPGWYADSKRALAVKGADGEFRHSMVACYRNLVRCMPDSGFQIVMFTHQDASVWADLALILWGAGLRVTAAWTVATETESPLKQGNYVQGTVAMVLRKQNAQETAFSDEVIPEVEDEVERQLAAMRSLDDGEDPNFADSDYQLAAYAAALRVLTRYASIEDIDVGRQLARERIIGERNPIEVIIEGAVRTASNFLVPEGLSDHLWRRLSAEEKLYLKGVEVESHGDYRAGVYQEFARGFGVRDYRFLLRTGKANETRLKTPSEFERRELGDSAFGRSLVRHALYATWRTIEDDTTTGALTWLRTELPDYWSQREALIGILRYLATMEIDHWQTDANAARLVAGAVENDHV